MNENQKSKVKSLKFKVTVALLFLSTFNFQLSTILLAQQPTSTSALFEVNSHYLGGRTWADYKASAGAGLTLNIAAGTAICGNPPAKVVYAGGTLTMTNAATNYVYLDPAATCVPASNTTGFTAGMIPQAQVVAAGGVITGVTDARTWFIPPSIALKVNIVTFSATPTFDASFTTQKITLTGNVTSSTLSNATTGETINFLICQDGTGSRTFVWPTNVLGAMTIGSTLSKCSGQTFIYDGTNAYALSAGVINM